MRRTCLNSLMLAAAWMAAIPVCFAMSHGPIGLAVKEVNGLPAACLLMKDENGDQPIKLHFAGVSHRVDAVTSENLWDIQMPETAKPFFLKRGECLVYGQKVDEAVVDTEAKQLQPNRVYGFGIVPYEGYVYGASFCIVKQANGQNRVVQPAADGSSCPGAQ